MIQASLRFKDVLLLLEFLDYTGLHHLQVDHEAATITGEFSEADIELAVNGYGAIVINGMKPVV